MATRVVSDLGGNFNVATTWVGGVVPSIVDDIAFTSTSGPLTLVQNITIAGINFTNYTNTINFNGFFFSGVGSGGVTTSINLGTGGYTQSGAGGISLSTPITLTSNGVVWSRALTFLGTSVTYTLADSWTVTGAISFSGTTATTINGNTLNIGGNLTVTTTAVVSGTTAFVFNGTGTWSHSATGVIRNNTTINTVGTLTIGANIYYNTGTLTYTAGTVTTTGSTLNIATSTTLNTKTVVWNTILTSGTSTITLTGNLNTTNLTVAATSLSFTLGGNILSIPGTLTINSTATFNTPSNLQVTNLVLGNGVPAAVVLTGAFTISVSGNLTEGHGGQTSSGTTSIVLNGTGTWSNGSNGSLRNNLTINTLGTITISGNVWYDTGTLTYTAGTVTTTGSTLNIATSTTLDTDRGATRITWNAVNINAGTTTLSSNLTVGGTLTLTGTMTGAFTLTTVNLTTGIATINITSASVTGNLTINNTTSGTSTIILDGTGAQTWSHGSPVYLSTNLTINKSAGTLTLGTNVYYSTRTLLYTTGTVNTTTNNSTLNINASTTLSTGTLAWNNVTIATGGGTYTITLGSNLKVNTLLSIINTQTLSFTLNTFSIDLSTANVSIQAISGAFTNITTTITLPGTISCVNFSISLNNSNKVTFNSSTVNVAGNLTLTMTSGSFVNGTSSIFLTGTGTFSMPTSGLLQNNLTINSPSGTITISGTISYNTGTLTYTTASSIITTGSTLNITASSTLDTSGMTWNNVNLAGTQTLTSGLNVGGNLTTQTTAVVLSGVVNINVGGNLAINITTSGTATIILNGTGAQTWSHGSAVYLLTNLTINKSAGSTLTLGANVYYSTGTLLYILGIVNTTTNSNTLFINASTNLNTNGIIWNNLTVVSTTTVTITLGSNLKVLTTFTMSTATTGYTLTITPGVYSVDFSTANVNIGTSTVTSFSFIYNGTINCVNFQAVAGNGYITTLTGTTFNISGNFTITTFGTGGSVAGTSTINLIGTGTVQQTNSGIYAVPVTNNFTINTTGTITFLSGTRFFYQTGIFTYTAGTVITTNVIFGILGSCTLDTDRGATQINWSNITSYATSTITLSSNLNITNLTSAGGTLSFTLGGNNLLISGDLTVNTSCSFTTPQNIQVVNLTLGTGSANSMSINGLFTISVSGNLIQTTASTGTTTIVLNGTGTWSNTSTGALQNNLTINSPSGTITIGTNVYYNVGTLTYVQGSVNTSGSTLIIPTAGVLTTTLNTNNLVWNNITGQLTNNTLNLLSDLYVSGTLNLNALGTLTISGAYTIYISGNFTNGQQTSIVGTASIVFNGTGTWSTVTYTGVLGLNTTINTTGTLTISGNVYYSTGTLTYITGIVATTGSTLFITAATTLDLRNLIWNNNITFTSGIQTLLSDLNIGGTLTTQTSAVTINGLFNVNIIGNITINITTSGTATIRFVGTGSWTGSAFLSNNVIIDTLGTLEWGNGPLHQTGSITYVKGKFAKNYWYIFQNMTLLGFNKSPITNVIITSGVTVTMNEFFSGKPGTNITISPSSTTNYTITFTDNFEKIAKFVNIIGATISRRNQLVVITDSKKSSINVGIRYVNSSPNGTPKGDPSIPNILTPGLGTILVGDPSFSSKIILPTVFDIDALRFIDALTASGTSLIFNQQLSINQLVLDLKAAGIWTKMSAVYPFIGGNATSHKFNLKNPLDTNAAFRLSFVGGWTHSSTGALPNGSNAYANTFLNAGTFFTSLHQSYYSRTDSAGGGFDIGFLTTQTSAYAGLILASAGTRGFANSLNIGAPTTTSANSLGLYTMSRTANNSWKVFKNDSAIIVSATGATATTAFPLYLAALPVYTSVALNNIQSYSNKECAFVSLGTGLTDAEVLALNRAVQNYQTTLGRQV